VQPNEFRVYDSSLVLKDTETYGISGPAGVAVGGHYKPKVFSLSKTDGGVSCVSPDQLLNYTIQYSANGYADTSVIITDYLPVEADFVLCSGGGTYDPAKHTVTWNIGSISSQGSGSLQLQVRINQFANPGGSITNVVKMEGANYRGEATKETNVCCWGGEIIYVDKDAIGYKNGISWDNAYKDLQDALTGARNCPEKTAIWVAAGTYKPTTNPQDYLATFDLVDGIVIYGHFGGIGTYETSIGQRDFGNTGNETTLDGQIGSTPYESVRCVVSATGLGEVTIDGVTVKGSYSGTGAAGAYVSDSNIRIANCTFKNNDASGVYCTTDGQRSLDVSNCRFTGNTGHGIFCHRYTNIVTNTVFEGNSSGERGVTTEQSSIDLLDCTLRNHTGSALYANISDVLMERCSVTNNRYGISCEDSNPSIVDSLIKDNSGEGLWCINFSCVEIARSNVCTNGLDGIYLQDGQTTKITDNWIYNNGTSHDPIHGCGIYIKTQIGELLIRNNTIYGNNKHGIYFESGNQPQVVNCIIWANNPQIGTASGNPLAYVEYCCVQDGYVGTGNISSPPSFVDPSAGDYHIMYNSPCVNTGKPDSTDPGETDIDGEPRVISGIVDMGADEWECFPHCHPDYDEWVLVGRPECWCYPRQCHGDADGLKEGSAKKGYYYVHFDDLNVLLAGWNTKEPPFGPGIATVTGPNGEPGICADFAHDKEGSSKKGYWRVHFNDLNILIASWDVNEPDFGPGIPPDCLDCQRGQQAKGGELSIEEIMKWIEEIWLDPEARKVIDEDAWLKFIQSLMEELQRLVNGEW
jgi:hypothetical protein